jgi:3-oxoacyl-[acyl-carrier protein] reductase
MRLEGKRALVTGGSRSIGRALAIALAREGADVVVNYKRHEEAAEDVVKAIKERGRRSVAVQASTDSKSDVERMAEEADRFLDGVDLLINNAGVLKRTPFLELTEEEWDWTLDTNLKGYFGRSSGS